MKLSTIKKIRMLPLLILGFLIFSIGLQALMVFTKENNVVIFKARVSKNFPEKTYHEVNSKKFNYVTGLEGKVYWKAGSFWEAFILTFFAGDNQNITALGTLYILTLDILLFWMLHDVSPHNIFSQKIKDALPWISLFLAFLTVRNIFQWLISNYILKEITDEKFTAPEEPVTMLPFLIGGFFIIPLLFHFVAYGEKIEQEQNLTI